MATAWLIYSAFFCAIWIMIYLTLIHIRFRLPLFHKFKITEPAHWPRLSILVPACNEEKNIESAIKSLLAQDYPDLEIILINDRSSDATGKIIDQLAARDRRIKPVHIKNLPAGWLGKVHALYLGEKQVTGELMLVTDADINFAPGVLRNAVSYLQARQIDHLALMPKVVSNNFWLRVAIAAFGLTFFLTTKAGQVNQPGSNAVIGIGAFNLVRHSMFKRTPGFEWLRMETVDDMGVGLMMKQAGGHTHFAIAGEHLSLGWYDSVAAMFRGLEKNLFGPGTGYNPWLTVRHVLMIWAMIIALPLAAFSGVLWLWELLGVVILFGALCAFVYTSEGWGQTLAFLLFPVGFFMISLMMIRATYKCIKNDGIDWRGTHYSVADLKAGQRVRF